METKIVNFQGDELLVVRNADGRIYVPMRRVCDYLGLSWQPQWVKLKDPFWADSVTMIVTNNLRQGPQEEVGLNIEFLPMFIAQIQVSRVKPEVQDKLFRYKTEARKVLADAFLRGGQGSNKYADHPMMKLTADFLRHEEEIRELQMSNLRMELSLKTVEKTVQSVDQTIDNLITHRSGHDPVPEGTITLPMIRKRYFFGISHPNISTFLNLMKHPLIPYTYNLREGSEINSFCYQETGLAEMFTKLLTDSVFVKSTSQRYYIRHPLIKDPITLKKAELPPHVASFFNELMTQLDA